MYMQSPDLSLGSIPAETLCKLRKHEIVIMTALLSLWSIARHKNPGCEPKCWPGEEYLAKRAGVTRSTISRSIQRLKEMHLIQGYQRRTRGGGWRTNVYYIGKTLLCGIKALVRRIHLLVSDRVRVGAHKRNNIIYSNKKTVPVDNSWLSKLEKKYVRSNV